MKKITIESFPGKILKDIDHRTPVERPKEPQRSNLGDGDEQANYGYDEEEDDEDEWYDESQYGYDEEYEDDEESIPGEVVAFVDEQ